VTIGGGPVSTARSPGARRPASCPVSDFTLSPHQKKRIRAIVLAAGLIVLAAVPLHAAAPPDLKLAVDGIGSVSAPLQIVLVLTLLSFLPAAVVIMTSFTRIVIVLHFLRQALGTQEMPPNQVLIGLTVFLTIFVMAPVADQINELAIQPAMAGKVSVGDAVLLATPPMRDFMLKQTRQKDLALFVEISHSPRPAQASDLPMRVVIPAYAISELKTGFQMGFFVFVPFLLIDLVVSTTLLSMGMMQLPPAMISLPFKVLLFVMVDGWNLIITSLVRSFA
jgi:flagellar biosynthetic protein FliP